MHQNDLFAGLPVRPPPGLPAGFRYQEELITQAEEQALLPLLRALPFAAFDFHGYSAKRRVLSFGWRYDFGQERLQRTAELPAFLLPLREVVAGFAAMPAESLVQVLVTEYEAGASIGWHRDKAVFERTVGLSLLAPCTFRLRRRCGERWERARLEAAPAPCISWMGRRAGTGSTASRPCRRCVTRSPSARCGRRAPPLPEALYNQPLRLKNR